MTVYSVEEMAGQRLMLGFDGTVLSPDLKQLIQTLRPGGLILFRPNIASPAQLARLTADAQAFARDCGLPPLFIAVDQEGGTVARLRHPFTEFPGNAHIHTVDAAMAFARTTARELTSSGINMNMAPVMDVAMPGTPSIMKDRAFPGDPALVAQLGSVVIRGLQDRGIMAVAKHFPGIGRTIKDSHFDLPVLDEDLAGLKALDLIPFEAARDAGVAGMMLSHIFYPRLDPDWQASLSPSIAQGLLRQKMGYQGLVMTDDLDMKAITHKMPVCVRQILAAEIDLILICHSGPNIRIARDEVLRLLDQDEAVFKKGSASMDRILAAKAAYLG